MFSFAFLDLVAGGLSVWLIHRFISSRSPRKRLPPGPAPLPLIGNVLDIPKHEPWKVYAEWSQRWGDVVSVTVLGQPLIILGSVKAANDLLEKRSAIYSDRPRLVCCGEIVGNNKALVLSPYNERMKTYRRMIAQCIGTRALVEEHADLLLQSVRDYLLRTAQSPEKVKDHIRRMTTANILLISHGYRVESGDDRFLQLAEAAAEDFSNLAAPGAFLVDSFPALRYVPGWVPGTGWKKVVAECRKTLLASVEEPFQWVKKEMAAGTALPSFTTRNLEAEKNEEYIKYAAMSLYSAGSDTTVSVLYSFYLAMTLYPEVLKKAQQEIDLTIGTDRLPTFADRDDLPYVNALCAELHRWMPVGPLGVAHRLSEDDEYNGYFHPKGSIVFVNVWKILHDPETYRDPTTFNPDRFLGSEPEMDPTTVEFGFGRRACPGMLVAQSTIFISVASALAVFDLLPVVKNGEVVLPIPGQTSGVISFPTPFECNIKLRSAKAAALLSSY